MKALPVINARTCATCAAYHAWKLVHDGVCAKHLTRVNEDEQCRSWEMRKPLDLSTEPELADQ